MLTGRVVDNGELIPGDKELALTTQLADLERTTGHQFVIVTTPSLQGKTVELYSMCLANHWAVGRTGVNDGVMLLVAPKERKVRIELGDGLERSLTDREADAILQTNVLPLFRKQDMVGGIEAGAAAIIREVSGT